MKHNCSKKSLLYVLNVCLFALKKNKNKKVYTKKIKQTPKCTLKSNL